MTIIDALQEEGSSLRVTNGDRWLVWDDNKIKWIVYQRPRYAKKTIAICETEQEAVAVEALMEEDT